MYEQLQPSQILTDVPYLSAVASVLFAAVFTRLDVALVISFLSRFSMRPFAEAWEQLTLLMIYLSGLHMMRHLALRCHLVLMHLAADV